MANIYYSQPANRRGILRAVLSLEESRNLLNQHMIHCAGKQFPTASQGPKVDFAVLQVFDGETNGEWKSGFYQFDDDITQIEATVQSHHATVAHVDAK
jgi:hypothetical protein